MNKFEFRGFTATPGEKHVGIAEVKLNGETPAIYRFKIIARKDGSGYFPNVGSYKMPNRSIGEEYDECFMLDSRSDHDSCMKCVMAGVNKALQAISPTVSSGQFQASSPSALEDGLPF